MRGVDRECRAIALREADLVLITLQTLVVAIPTAGRCLGIFVLADLVHKVVEVILFGFGQGYARCDAVLVECPSHLCPPHSLLFAPDRRRSAVRLLEHRDAR